MGGTHFLQNEKCILVSKVMYLSSCTVDILAIEHSDDSILLFLGDDQIHLVVTLRGEDIRAVHAGRDVKISQHLVTRVTGSRVNETLSWKEIDTDGCNKTEKSCGLSLLLLSSCLLTVAI